MANKDITAYNNSLETKDKVICRLLQKSIDSGLKFTESKIWHGAPVWFIDGNPVVGYSKQKAGVRLLFWSGADFAEPKLIPGTGKFKDASALYTDKTEVKPTELKRWLKKAEKIQWDYKNIVKRKGKLVKVEK